MHKTKKQKTKKEEERKKAPPPPQKKKGGGGGGGGRFRVECSKTLTASSAARKLAFVDSSDDAKWMPSHTVTIAHDPAWIISCKCLPFGSLSHRLSSLRRGANEYSLSVPAAHWLLIVCFLAENQLTVGGKCENKKAWSRTEQEWLAPSLFECGRFLFSFFFLFLFCPKPRLFSRLMIHSVTSLLT